MKRQSDLFLKDILKEIEMIEKFTKDLFFEDFKNDDKTIYAVTRSLEIIGEATSQLPKEIIEKYSKVPWQEIKDMRNVIVHQYWGVDINTEWDVIIHELDKLKQDIEKILKKENLKK